VLALAPAAERALARAADLAREDERALARRALAIAGGEASTDLARIARAPVAVRRRVLRRMWRNAGGRAAALEAKHVEAMLALARRGRPGRAALPGGLEARCRYGRIEIGEPARPARAFAPVAVPGPGRYEVPRRGVVEVAALKPDEVPWPLSLRTRRPGDRFRPEGGRGTKKLKSWLIDRKVPRQQRDRLLVLADASGNVLWLPDLSARAAALGLGLRLLREEG
jgi:tRNA(Ile)-lysidine synthase